MHMPWPDQMACLILASVLQTRVCVLHLLLSGLVGMQSTLDQVGAAVWCAQHWQDQPMPGCCSCCWGQLL